MEKICLDFFYCGSQNRIILNGLTFINSNIENYAAMTVGYGQIINCNFINNSCKNAMVVDGQNFAADHCNFINNVGCAIRGYYLNMTYCNFVGNSRLSAVICHY